MTLSFVKPKRAPDFEDEFCGANAYPEMTGRELAVLAIDQTPRWFRILFWVRQFLARIGGLRTETAEGAPADVAFLLSLPVLVNEPDCYEAGLADKHLDFTLSVEKHKNRVRIVTKVWFNNNAGRAYLFFIRPFHNRIVGHWVRVLGIKT